ncbi:MAG: AAA family ATPase [Gammaproteobacteria bacterium]
MARRAALITRQAKQSIERGALRDLWRAEIREAGLAPLRVMPRAPEKTTATTMDWEPLLRRAVRRLQSTDIAFTELDLLVSCREIIAAKKQTVDAFALANAVRAFVERGILLPSDAPRGKTDAYYTTKAAKRLEHQIVARLAASAQVFETGFMTQADIERCLSRYDGKAKPPRYRTLDAGQRQAIIEALSSRDRYHIIQGNAGSGKTTLLNELRQVMMKELGVLVRRSGALRALASTHVAANELQKSLGVTATTLDHFLVQKAEKNAQNEVWLVDEASMMDVKKLQALMDRAEAANARVILIGDANQLESVGPGRALYLTQKAGVQVSRVEKIYRQENDALREVAEHINAQQHVLALDKLNQMDGVRESSHVNTAILQHLSGLSGSAILEHVVVTPTNEDRMELTRGIRDVLQQKGVVQQQNVQMEAWVPRIIPEVELQYSDQYQVGDLLRFNRRLHVATSAWKTRLIKANEYYEVLGKTPEALLIRSHATGERFEFPVATLGDRSAGAVFVYEKNTTDLSVNDRLRWLDNRNDLGLKRNQVLTVVRVSADRVELAQGKRRITIDPRRLNHSHFEHAYAVTAQGAQGISAASVLVAAPWWRRNSVNQRSLLVGVTRAKQKLLVFTENLAKLKHEIGQRYADNSQALQQHERQRALGAFL